MRKYFNLSVFLCFFVIFNSSQAICSIKYYSQLGQDKWVMNEVFKGKTNGFFLDIGAANGIELSNTYTLEKFLDWNGICIEANPIYFEQLTKNRSCQTANVCLDFEEHQVEFLIQSIPFARKFGPKIDAMLFGGIIDDDTDNNMELRKEFLDDAYAKNQVIELFTQTLESVLKEHNAPKVIDYLSIDIEGAETRVLRDFPFDEYTFLAISIERPNPELNKILFENGYVFVRNYIHDTFYVHKSIENFDQIKKEPFSQIRYKIGI